MKPNLKLIINIKKEIGSVQGFIKYSDYVDRFLPINFQYILSKKFSPAERNKICEILIKSSLLEDILEKFGSFCKHVITSLSARGKLDGKYNKSKLLKNLKGKGLFSQSKK